MKRVTILMTPEQYRAIRDEATKRATGNGGKADASAIIRELVERWMKSRRGD